MIVLPVEKHAEEQRAWFGSCGREDGKKTRARLEPSRKVARRNLKTKRPGNASKKAERQPTNTESDVEHEVQVKGDSQLLVIDHGTELEATAASKGIETSTAPDGQSQVLRPFRGGEMVFFPDRVELCGVCICRGRRAHRLREGLDLLRQKQDNGKFVEYSASELAERLQIDGGQNGASGLIRDLRNRIKETLLKAANIDCGRHDVILSGGPGYRFNDWITVQDGNTSGRPSEQGQAISIGSVDGPVVDPVVGPVDGTVRGPVDGTVTAKTQLPVPADHIVERRNRLLAELATDRKLRAPGLADALGCSERTVKRDIVALRDRIEFVGNPGYGYYQLREVKKPR